MEGIRDKGLYEGSMVGATVYVQNIKVWKYLNESFDQ